MSDRLNLTNIARGIDVIDSGYYSKDFAAIYLLKQNNKIALIETGNNFSIPLVEKALIEYGLGFSDVAYIIPTHVHLDHAGGAGVRRAGRRLSGTGTPRCHPERQGRLPG